MDMSWIDMVHDPDPKQRNIYSVDDYDTQFGNPYYREHNQDTDSLWTQYEQSGATVSFDEYADEARQADWELEIGDLANFFSGDTGARSTFENPLGGRPLIAVGSIQRWDGDHSGVTPVNDFDELLHGSQSPFKDCEIDRVWDENGRLYMSGHHHDGGVQVEIRQLTDKGIEAIEAYDQAWLGDAFDAGGRHYKGDDESVSRFWKDLTSDWHLSEEPRYLARAFDCKPAEWDVDQRVVDFAKHMSDEYGRLYEKGSTGITGQGDFDRFDAFVDDHLDFVRALVKARGELINITVNPISSDREVAAFLNTYDTFAKMDEPDHTSKDTAELSATVCDPADPLNQSESVVSVLAR